MSKEKKLYKSKTDKKISGVCGGLAKYLGIDSTIVRLLCVLLILAYGSGLLLYIICALIIPEDPEEKTVPAADVENINQNAIDVEAVVIEKDNTQQSTES